MAENKVNLLTEGFSVENAKKESGEVKISGFALPFDTTSRNGFSYRKESIVKQHKSLEGKNIFLNHNLESLPLGKVTKSHVDEKGMHYEATLIPTTEEEKAIVKKVQQGLLDKVSIQCIYSNAKVNEKTGEFSVDVSEFLELSLVGVPGFEDTTAMAHEKLTKENKIKMAAKKIKEELQKPEEETSTEQDDEQNEAPVSRAEYEELMSRVSVLESRLDAEDEESEESADEEKEDKKEESEDSKEDEKQEESSEDEEEDKSEEKVTRKTKAPQTSVENTYDRAAIRYKRMMSR